MVEQSLRKADESCCPLDRTSTTHRLTGFATVGDYKTLRVWDVRENTQTMSNLSNETAYFVGLKWSAASVAPSGVSPTARVPSAPTNMRITHSFL